MDHPHDQSDVDPEQVDTLPRRLVADAPEDDQAQVHAGEFAPDDNVELDVDETTIPDGADEREAE